MKEIELSATLRELKPKSNLSKVRAAGNMPAVLYGEKKEAIPLAISVKEFGKAITGLSGKNVILHLKLKTEKGEESKLALLKDLQFDPVEGHFLHADFQRISMDKKIVVKVPIIAVGVSVGVEAGGILEYLSRTLTVRCLPKDIPDVIQVDVTQLKVAEAMHVKDMTPPEGVEIAENPKKPVVMIGIPSELKEEELAAAAPVTAEEPEVIGEKERLERRAAKEAEGGKEGAPEAAGKEGAKDAKAAPAKAAPAAAGKEAKGAKK